MVRCSSSVGRRHPTRVVCLGRSRPVRSVEEVARVDRGEAQRLVDLGREISGIAFAVYIGEISGPDSMRAQLAELPDPDGTVLVAVDPDQHAIEIVTGSYAMSRVNDHACQLAVLAVQSCASAGDIAAGVRDGLVLLAEHARAPRVLHLDEPA